MYNYKESHSSKHTNNTCNTLPVKCTKQKRCFSHHTLEQEYPQNISICCAICVMSVQLSAPLPFFLDCSLEALFKPLTLSTLQVHWEEKATSVSTWRVQSFLSLKATHDVSQEHAHHSIVYRKGGSHQCGVILQRLRGSIHRKCPEMWWCQLWVHWKLFSTHINTIFVHHLPY